SGGRRAASNTAQPVGAQRPACAPIHFSLRSRIMFFSWRNWLRRNCNPHRRPRRPARRRGNSQRVFLRLEECERMELPNGLLAAMPWVGEPALAATAAAVETSSPACLAAAWTSDGAFRYGWDGDNPDAPSYNAWMAEWAARYLEGAAAAAEARPAMTQFFFENPEQPEQLPPPQPERPLADPFETLTNPLAEDYFGLAALAFGGTASSSSSTGAAGAVGGPPVATDNGASGAGPAP